MAGFSSVHDAGQSAAGQSEIVVFTCVEEQLDASAVSIWQVLTDFDHPQRLAPTIDSVSVIGTGIGAIRIVRSSRGLTIHEALIACDHAQYQFCYAALESGDMPFDDVTAYRCAVQLIPVSPVRTTICWRSEGRAAGPIAPIEAFFSGLYRQANQRIMRQIAGLPHWRGVWEDTSARRMLDRGQ